MALFDSYDSSKPGEAYTQEQKSGSDRQITIDNCKEPDEHREYKDEGVWP